MVTSLNKACSNLAKNLRGLRQKRQLTQARLAELAGMTRASIALIESGSSNPSLEILLKLSLALQISLDELIAPAQAECLHLKAQDIPLDRRSKNGVQLRKLLPDKIRATEMDEIALETGATLTGSPHVEGTKEYFSCMDGEFTITVLGQSYHLEKGDVLTFPGDKPHAYKNRGKHKARGVSVVFFNPNT